MSLVPQPSVSQCFQSCTSAGDSEQLDDAAAGLGLVQLDNNETTATLPSEQAQLGEEETHNIYDCLPENQYTNQAIENHNDVLLSDTEEEELNDQRQEQDGIAPYPQDPIDITHAKEINITSHDSTESLILDKKRELPEDMTNFLGVLYDLLECPVCLNQMVPPILMCVSGHNICFRCRPFLTKCPLCRRAFLQTRNVALEIVARNLRLPSNHDCYQECLGLKDEDIEPAVNQITYTCPLTLYTHCYWQGHYSDIRKHIEEAHANKILIQGNNPKWEMKLLVRDMKIIFALDEIFFYRERLDTSNAKFYIQVFYVGQHEIHSRFSYRLEISSESGQQRYAIQNRTLPINDLEHAYTYTASHCTVLDYQIVSEMSKKGDLKCTLSLGMCSEQ